MHQMEEYWAVEGVGMETSRHECTPRKDAVGMFCLREGAVVMMIALWALAFATAQKKREWNVYNTEKCLKGTSGQDADWFSGFAADMQANYLKRARALLPCFSCLWLLGAVLVIWGWSFGF